MDKLALRAFGYFMAANFQAVVVVGAAFELVSYLKSNYPNFEYWPYVVWPTAVLVIANMFYLILRQLVRSEAGNQKKK